MIYNGTQGKKNRKHANINLPPLKKKTQEKKKKEKKTVTKYAIWDQAQF